MNINFKMWRTAAWQLVKMEDKKKWDALDVVSKWLIATRSGVTTVTIYSCIIAGLLERRIAPAPETADLKRVVWG